MPTQELRDLAEKLGRPVRGLAELDAIGPASLRLLLDRVESIQLEEAEALKAARRKALPGILWRLALLGVERQDT